MKRCMRISYSQEKVLKKIFFFRSMAAFVCCLAYRSARSSHKHGLNFGEQKLPLLQVIHDVLFAGAEISSTILNCRSFYLMFLLLPFQNYFFFFFKLQLREAPGKAAWRLASVALSRPSRKRCRALPGSRAPRGPGAGLPLLPARLPPVTLSL